MCLVTLKEKHALQEPKKKKKITYKLVCIVRTNYWLVLLHYISVITVR